MKCLKNK